MITELRWRHIIAGHGHGGGKSDGVMGLAPDAKILPVGRPEFGGGAEGTDLGDWIKYAVDQGASVINMSIEPTSLSDADKRSAGLRESRRMSWL